MKVCIIQARCSSNRLPNKVLLPLGEESVIERVARLCRSIIGIDKVIVATSTDASDDPIEELCKKKDIHLFRGDLNNVLKRFYDCAQENQAHYIVRITADCPLMDPQIPSQVLQNLIYQQLDYCSNVAPPTWPDGVDCEAFTMETLKRVFNKAHRPSHFEHVTSYINEHLSKFKTSNYICPLGNLSDQRWTLDYKEDYQFIQSIVEKSNNLSPSYLETIEIISKNAIKSFFEREVVRNEGYVDDQKNGDQKFSFKRSKAFLQESESLIPVGCPNI